ncbi:outer membrane receptor for ferrienterochelin and colicins [Algoriphagus boseongensis]|uniref:Outer membrane receptor for ferrienterochelin and colicins n=1 Tax=Algoriphagus boseongensis TaxID=1442587 RepID=A0A4R6T7L6_9BACT|nr:TonB-dependent receptor [Algoriphagus boseongensis]TDQ19178.1 outer membrane receptor for ferrienterochelin and colicins [Algoriphagus boseongensis]
MSKITFLWICLFFSIQKINAQFILKGKVLADSKPIEFANILLKGTSKGTITDSLGFFHLIDVPAGTYQIQVSRIGYVSESVSLSIPFEKGEFLSIELKEMDNSLDEVVVSGTLQEVSKLDSPVPVEVYKSAFFKANPTPSLFESLQNVNGVRPQVNCNVCNTGDIHINGLEGPYTMVLIDGMPIVSGLATVYGLTGIPQALIDRIEVVKGPASTLYGSEAVGGLINIITKKPELAPLTSLDVMATNWGEVNLDLGMKSKIGKKINSLTGLSTFWYSNPIDKNLDGFTDVPLQKRFSLFQKFQVERKGGKVFSLAGRYLYEDRWGGEMTWTPEFRGGDQVYGESIYTSRWELFGLYDFPEVKNLAFQFSLNGHHQNSVYGNTPYLADQRIGFGQLTWRKEGERNNLLLGAAYRYTFYDDNTPATGGTGPENSPSKIHLPGAFVQNEFKFSTRSSLLAGMRYDYNSVHGNIFSPRINFKISSFDKTSVLRFSVGNGFRVANVFTEDHAALTGAREVVFSEELAPEKSWNGNVNWVKKFFTDQGNYFGLDASAFYTNFSNRIVPDYETNPNQIIYSNLDGGAVSKGLSLNFDAVLNSGFKFMVGGTFMDVSLEEDGDKVRQLLTERFSGVWTIGYTFPSQKLSIDYTGNVYSPMRLPLLGPLDNRPEYSPWWSIQNIQLTQKIGEKWEVYGGVKNLLNFTPPANSIARAFDPFDSGVDFDDAGQVIPTPQNPNALTFDPTYVFAPNQGIRGFFGLRFTLD